MEEETENTNFQSRHTRYAIRHLRIMPKSTQRTDDNSAPVASQFVFSTEVPARVLSDKKIAYDVLRYIPEESAEHYKLVPLAVEDGSA